MTDPLSITDRERLFALIHQREKGDAVPSVTELSDALLARVRGQDHIVADMVRLIRQQKAKVRRDRPVANLLFVGPTGTGKTELAKALCAALYGDEGNLVRFDCGELTPQQGKNRLIGSARGFAQAEQGGELTRKMLANPNRVVLFDEVEKASSDVYDLFLSMMGEGRLQEQGSGKVADFTRSIIVLTSNKEHEAIAEIDQQIDDYYEKIDAIKKHLAHVQAFRPEILGRFDRIYVFRPLPPDVVAEIIALKAIALARQYDLDLEFVDPHVLYEAYAASRKVADFGTREVVRVLDTMFADGMVAAREAGAKRVRIDQLDTGELSIVAVDAEGGSACVVEEPARRLGAFAP